MLISVFLRHLIAEWEASEYTFMSQKFSLLLKKETKKISLWLIMSFQNEKWREESLILIKIMALGQLWVKSGSLTKVS